MSKPPVLRLIWTPVNPPGFGIGKIPLGCWVECKGPFELGRGFMGYKTRAPNGTTVISEASSGVIVGDSLEEVRKDLRKAKISVIQGQIWNARRQKDRVCVKDEHSFWLVLRREKR